MAVVVVGGHSRNVGKTSVMASLIAAMPELHWTAMKITEHRHEDGRTAVESGDCRTDDPNIAVSVEHDPDSGTDTSRFLAAGAVRSLWIRTHEGMLSAAMPWIRKELSEAENAILESNSVLKFLRPDLYLIVLDARTSDFKDSARLFLEQADAVLVNELGERLEPLWEGISAEMIEIKPKFVINPPNFISEELVEFVRRRLTALR